MKILTALALGLLGPAMAGAQEAIGEHERIIISSTPLGGDLFEQTQSVTVLTEDELELQLEPTLGETLNREPGVSSTYFGPGASRPVIRGLGEDRIRVLQNGVNTIDVSNVSPDHAVTTEPLTIKTIDVVRGPATLLYGPNTVGGVVNVIDNRIATEPLPRLLVGKVEGRAATADDLLSAAGVVDLQLGPLILHLDGYIRETDDVEIPGFARSDRLRRLQPLAPGEEEARGILPNSFTESEGGAAGLSYVSERGHHGVAYSTIDSRYGTVAEEDVTIELAQRRWDLRGAFNQPFAPIKAINYKWSYSDYRHTEFEGAEVGTVFEINGYEGRLEVLHEKLGSFEGAIGYQGQMTDFSAVGAEAYLPPTEITSHAIFVFEELALERVRLQFGARYDHQSNERSADPLFGPALTRAFDAVGGSAGLVYTPTDEYAIAFSAAYTQRPPTYVELFASGPHIATNAFEIGDPALSKEESIAFDLSLRRKIGRVTGAVSVFYYRFSDFITAEPTSEEDDGLPVFRYRAVEANFVGGELEATVHITEHPTREPVAAEPAEAAHSPHSLHLDLKADYVHAQNQDSDRSLPRITPFRTSAALVYGWHDRFSARVEGQYAHEQNRTAAFELPTDGYFLLNASLSYRLPVRSAALDVYLKGTNLTNAEARLHTSFLKDVAPMPGRGVLVGVRASF